MAFSSVVPRFVSHRQAATPLNEPPIILQVLNQQTTWTYGGDLWEWTGNDQPLRRLTNNPFLFDPVLSPDGSQIAFLAPPNFVTSQFQTAGPVNQFPPADVEVLDLATGKISSIAQQPPDASYTNQHYIRRPAPAWSPDGKSLAWIEQVNATGVPLYDLVIYDVATRTNTRTVKDVPGPQVGDEFEGEQIFWSKAGLAYILTNHDANGHVLSRILYLYNERGQQQVAVQIPLSEFNTNTILWADLANKPVALFGFGDTGSLVDYVYDPANGTLNPLASQLEMTSTAASNGLVLTGLYDDEGDHSWTISGTSQSLDEPIALSPDGRYVATIEEGDHLALYDKNGQALPITLSGADVDQITWIGWGAVTYRVR